MAISVSFVAPTSIKGSRSFGYDNQGNQTSDGTKTLTFDFDNKLKIWSNSSPASSVSYTYDAQGNRIGKVGGGTTRQFANSTVDELSKVLVDKNTTNSTSNFYVYGD